MTSNHPDTIYLMDQKKALTDFWSQCFADFDAFVVDHGDLFEQPADALVSPANSFGFMDGGIDKAIRDHLPSGIQSRVQAMIVAKYHGEMPIGCAEIVETGSRTWPLLVVAPTMRVPEPVPHTLNAYLAFRAVLNAVLKHNADPARDRISTLLVPGLATGWGAMEPRKCAAQMRMAWNAMSRPARIPSIREVHAVHRKLRTL